MRARRTTLGYQGDCRSKEAVVDQEDMGAPVSFGGHERPRMQQAREQEFQELTSGSLRESTGTGMITAQVEGVVVGRGGQEMGMVLHCVLYTQCRMKWG
jgi:hypothetical protein